MSREADTGSAEDVHDSGRITALPKYAGDDLTTALILQMTVFVSVGALLLLLMPEASLSIRLLLIALVFLTLKRWAGIVVLMLVQADLFYREGKEFELLNGFGGQMFVFVVMAVLMLVARQRRLLQQMTKGSVVSLARELMSANEEPAGMVPVSTDDDAFTRLTAAALRGLLMIFVCVSAGRIILGLIPDNRQLTGTLREVVNRDPALITGGLVLVALVATWVVVGEIAWRQITPAQARMYLRSQMVKLHYRDLRMIVSRRLKDRTKRLTVSDSRTEKSSR